MLFLLGTCYRPFLTFRLNYDSRFYFLVFNCYSHFFWGGSTSRFFKFWDSIRMQPEFFVTNYERLITVRDNQSCKKETY